MRKCPECGVEMVVSQLMPNRVCCANGSCGFYDYLPLSASELFPEYIELKGLWEGLNVDLGTYQDWLESQVTHWRKCYRAQFNDEAHKFSYNEQELIDNLKRSYAQLLKEFHELELLYVSLRESTSL